MDGFKIGFGLFVIILWAVGLVGWIWNIVKIFGLWGAAIGTELVIRLVGVIVAPLGAIAGYF